MIKTMKDLREALSKFPDDTKIDEIDIDIWDEICEKQIRTEVESIKMLDNGRLCITGK
jgi:hypothetical protein